MREKIRTKEDKRVRGSWRIREEGINLDGAGYCSEWAGFILG